MTKRIVSVLVMLSVVFVAAGREVKVLYWNIQNGMWHDQGNNYDNFVEFVRGEDPDICVWCEAESRYVTGTAQKMQMPEEQYLPWNWDLLARRYGHNYTLVCGKRDTFPQVITSKYPLMIVKRITGNGDDTIVAHGAGWAVVELGHGREINIVTLHTWPHKYAYLAEDKDQSAASFGGDKFRAAEMKYICEETIGMEQGAEKQNWIMLGDFNAISSLDNFYYGKPEESTEFLVHDYILENTPYLDLVHERYPGQFMKSTLSGRRIDMVYVTPALYKRIGTVTPLYTGFADLWRDPRDKGIHNFCHPSDHYPIVFTIK